MPTCRVLVITSIAVLGVASTAAAQAPAPQDQIRAAVSPAPEDLRDSATVLGYGDADGLVELRRGDGPLICLADNPADERFHVACYHQSLEPFMARGRELRAGGAERAEVVSTRGEEIAGGKLAFPREPSALFSLTGPSGSFDPEAQVVRGGNRVTSVYIAYATGEETGLPTKPVGAGKPWLMAAGEPWAHIMVVQPSDEETESSD